MEDENGRLGPFYELFFKFVENFCGGSVGMCGRQTSGVPFPFLLIIIYFLFKTGKFAGRENNLRVSAVKDAEFTSKIAPLSSLSPDMGYWL